MFEDESVEVLNGTIVVGDQIAWAVTTARHGGGMRIGNVLGFDQGRDGKPRVKAVVTKTSGFTWQQVPYKMTVDMPKRIIKLGESGIKGEGDNDCNS